MGKFVPNRMIHIIDFEIYKHLWVCVILCLDTLCVKVIVNKAEELKDYYYKHSTDIFVGFNIKGYDQFIMRYIIISALNPEHKANPKDLSDWIVSGNDGWTYVDGSAKPGCDIPNELWKIHLNIYDVQSSFSRDTSLKQIEGFRGISIEETDVDFNIDRELTDEEIRRTVKYCKHDVEATAWIFLQKKVYEDFKAHYILATQYCGDKFDKAIRATNPILIAMVLGAKKKEFDDGWDFVYPKDILRLGKYAFVEELFKDIKDNHIESELTITVGSAEMKFALGGLHASSRNFLCKEGKFLYFDVSSYYPSIMLRFDMLSRAITKPEIFRMIYDQRLTLKKEQLEAEDNGNFELANQKKLEQLPYKLVLNMCFGASGGKEDKGNPLYDLRNQRSICVTGQLLLLDLVEKLEDMCKIVQANTDGILVQVTDDNEDEIRAVCDEWSKRTGMMLEGEVFNKVFQKAVNDYIAVTPDGKIKGKGSDAKDKSDIDNNLPILSKALRAHYIDDIPVEDTVNKCNDLIEFQQICHAGSKREYAMIGRELLPDGSNKLANKTNRVFASKNKNSGCIYTKMGNNAKKPGMITKFPNCPDNVFINNGDVRKLSVPDELDREFYIQKAKEAIEKYETPDPKNIKTFEIAKAATEAALACDDPVEGYRAAVAKTNELQSLGRRKSRKKA